jgi:hypothetical protein
VLWSLTSQPIAAIVMIVAAFTALTGKPAANPDRPILLQYSLVAACLTAITMLPVG